MPNLTATVPVGMENYVHAYFGVWAIADQHANGLLALARGMDLSAHLAKQAQRHACEECDEEDEDDEENVDDPREASKKKHKALMASLPGIQSAGAFDGYITSDGIAVIESRGTMMKFSSSFSAGASTVRIRRSLREAKNDSRVRGILWVVDSPGGTVAGTAELADEVAAVNAVKPIWVYGEDLLASAAYWPSSQAKRIGAGRTALVGSCGSIMVLYDMSEMFAEAGVKPKVYKSGERKGSGTAGTEITEEDDKYFQLLIDETTTHFRNAVTVGRPRAKVESAFKEAGVYIAQDARERGLIDTVCSVETYYNEFVQSLGPAHAGARAETETDTPAAQVDDAQQARQAVVEDQTPAAAGEGVEMSTPATTGATPGAAGGAQPAVNNVVAQASLEQLEQACPGANNDFLVGQLKQKATVETARTAYMTHLLGRAEAAEKAVAPVAQGAATTTTTTAAPPATTTATATPAVTPAATTPATTAAAPAATGVAPVVTKPSAETAVDTTASEELERKAKVYVDKGMSASAARQRILSADAGLRERISAESIAERKSYQEDLLRRRSIGV